MEIKKKRGDAVSDYKRFFELAAVYSTIAFLVFLGAYFGALLLNTIDGRLAIAGGFGGIMVATAVAHSIFKMLGMIKEGK